MANLYGPVEGKRDDSGMLAMSGLLDALQRYSVSPYGNTLCIYGDPAYPLRRCLQAPFRGAVLTPDQQAWNKSMKEVRVSVEWIFGDIINYFKFLDFKKDLKIGLSSVGKKHYYITHAQFFMEIQHHNILISIHLRWAIISYKICFHAT